MSKETWPDEAIRLLQRACAIIQTASENQPARPEPEHEVGEWWVKEYDCRWVREITGREYRHDDEWGYNYQLWMSGKEELPEATGAHWRNFADMLPIPPRPAKPWGHKLTGEVRVPKQGETYIGLRGEVRTAHFDHSAASYPFGGRKWIAEAEAPAYRKGQLVCFEGTSNQVVRCMACDGNGIRVQYLDGCATRGRETQWHIANVRPAVASDLTAEQWMRVAQDLIDAQGDRT